MPYWQCIFFGSAQRFKISGKVQKQIKQVLGIAFGLDPALCILGILPDKRMDGDVT